MKYLPLSAFPILLFGCSGSNEMPDLRTQLAPELVSQLPVSVMLVELPKAQSAALTGIDTIKGDTVTWRSLEDQSLSLQDGVVIATRGLAFDLMGSEVGLVPQAIISNNESKAVAVRSYSFLNGENAIQTVSYECTYEVLGPEMVDRLNGQSELLSVKETCPKPGADIVNRYYFDQLGRQITSSQWLGDMLGYAIVEFVN